MILESEVLITLAAKNIKHFETLGYEIPRKADRDGRSRVACGSQILVKVCDLLPGSTLRVTKVCDFCGTAYLNQEYHNVIRSRNQGKDCCRNCSSRVVSSNRSLAGHNFATSYPHLMNIWHPTKNVEINPYKVPPRTSRKVWWLCNCGWEWSASIGDVARGSGCPACAASAGEKVVLKYLRESGVSFVFQYKVKGLVGKKGRSLLFDFAINDDSGILTLLIEVDGPQHSIPVNFLNRDHEKVSKKFERQKLYDNKKEVWAAGSGVTLLRLEYDRVEGFKERATERIHTALQEVKIGNCAGAA